MPLTFDDLLRVDVRKLVRWAGPHPGWRGTLHWSPTGSEASYVLLREARGARGVGQLILSWRRVDGRRVQVDVALVSTVPRFGGLRWWAQCPGCGRRCAVLAIAGQASRLACRVCLQVGYQSQLQRPHDRAADRCEALRRRHGGPASVLEGWYEKPPRMHWRTWDRVQAEDHRLRGAALARWGVVLGMVG